MKTYTIQQTAPTHWQVLHEGNVIYAATDAQEGLKAVAWHQTLRQGRAHSQKRTNDAIAGIPPC